ncbi:GFA family protein [Amylibacter sp. SFDW26]|uniref:GFA family protein n=1 Tax=Amylibacter sp. SFDW26 TaxID=2652722 RepID=UPI00126167CF|nr:GFA family protein [Amylibacter sp. SFDW26]KAB7615488.1 GFA family protein [Amylibacter sp. SFDW26]
MSVGFKGSCLCGAVTYKSSADPVAIVSCHCADCRKSSGTGHCTHMGIPEAAFTILGDVSYFDKGTDSGNMVRRHFCPTCGSPIYSTNSSMKDMVFPRASILDDRPEMTVSMAVYASRATAWDPVIEGVPTFAEMPPQSDMPEM